MRGRPDDGTPLLRRRAAGCGADPAQLRYQACIGDLSFIAGTTQLDYSDIPLLDFAASMEHIHRCMRAGSAIEQFDFPEGDDVLSLSRRGATITLLSDAYGVELELDAREWWTAVRDACGDICQRCAAFWPSLGRNPTFDEITHGLREFDNP